MRIWLVNPFDPLPGDPEQEGRYGTLTRMLINKGHEIVWWTSSFSHRFKKPVDQAELKNVCDELGVELVFLQSPDYQNNVSIKRLWNHFVLAKEFKKVAKQRHDNPDVILASAPPPFLAKEAVKSANRFGAKAVVDIQDLWPETFYRLGPSILRRIKSLFFLPWQKASKDAYLGADIIVGVADEYANHAVRLGAKPKEKVTIPLGIDLEQFQKAAESGKCVNFTKPDDEIWFAYTGSLNVSYDCLTLAKAFIEAEKKTDKKLKLFITGRGQLDDELDNIIAGSGTKNIVRTGFLDFPQWAYLLSQCDVGFNASFPEAMIYLPNKIFYYFAAGCAVLNTIPGQCCRIITEGNCGLDYKAGDISDCSQAILKIVNDIGLLDGFKFSSAKLAKDVYDRKVLYNRYVNILE